MSKEKTTLPSAICWFRQDLRISDNPAFSHAIQEGSVLPIYILDDKNALEHKMGGASRVWLHHSLNSLNQSLQGYLALYEGDALSIIMQLCSEYKITKIFWNRCYEPWRIKRDEDIKKELSQNGIHASSYNGSLLWEPWQVTKEDKTPYKIFTPFYQRGCQNAPTPRAPLPQPDHFSLFKENKFSYHLDQLKLLPHIPWHNKPCSYWDINETAAHQRLTSFFKKDLSRYKKGRDFPAEGSVSRLSPYLHFGQISPHQIWQAIMYLEDNVNLQHFKSELAWREFSYNLLYFNPTLPKENLQKKFNAFPWKANLQNLVAWQKGLTGIPMVDAGMRELWQTGYMHNRVRMIVGSFLVKNLLLDWRHGEQWFWDCLFDADLANNSASWQWVAGCGTDAAPYFRIFNPVTQGEKFDPDAQYIRQYIPEIKNLPNKYIFSPWEVPESVLKESKITLGVTYPKPIVDLKKSREDALMAFKKISLPCILL
jgi:deoxyribodipyrimidine photo-lyase